MELIEYDPLFKTLAEAGYESCKHPRMDTDVQGGTICADCGAHAFVFDLNLYWRGGSMTFERRKLVNFKDDPDEDDERGSDPRGPGLQ